MVDSLFFADYGSGTAVVFLHAFALDHSIWLPVAEKLKENTRVILPDLRGHGRSPAPEENYTMRGMAEDILKILDDLSIEKAVLAGNSMGGYVSLAFAQLFPERLAGLALVASHVYADPLEKRTGRLADMERLKQEPVAEVLQAMPAKLSRIPSVVESCREIIGGNKPSGMIGALAAMAERPDMANFFVDLSLRSIIIAGQEDQFIPIEQSRKMAELMKKPLLVEIPQAGHLPMLDQPQQTYLALQDFLIETERRNQ
jgi:pimeloyl-ACP methyl ester carboxylesterase